MTEATLSLGFSDLQAEVGHFLGYGSTTGSWSSDQTAAVDAVIQAGIRQFYHPPIIPGENIPHKWSFLEPVTALYAWPDTDGTMSGAPSYDGSAYSTVTATTSIFYETMETKTLTFDTSDTAYTIYDYISATQVKVTGDASGETSGDTFTVNSDGDYALPDDCGGIVGPLTFAADQAFSQVVMCGEGQIRANRQYGSNTGIPVMAARRSVTLDPDVGQRFQIMLWPTPDTLYTLSYRKMILLNKLTTGDPYPWGGMPHSETLKEACLDIAEQRMNDEVGLHHAKFMERLTTSVWHDRRVSGPEYYGHVSPLHNMDMATGRLLVRSNLDVTYNGQTGD